MTILSWFQDVIASARSKVNSVFQTVKSTTGRLLGTIGGVFKKGKDFVVSSATAIYNKVAPIVSSGVSTVSNVVTTVYGDVKGGISAYGGAVVGAVRDIGGGVKSVGAGLGEGIKAVGEGVKALPSGLNIPALALAGVAAVYVMSKNGNF